MVGIFSLQGSQPQNWLTQLCVSSTNHEEVALCLMPKIINAVMMNHQHHHCLISGYLVLHGRTANSPPPPLPLHTNATVTVGSLPLTRRMQH